MDSPRHLVLTAPSVTAPLADQLAELRAAFRRLRQSDAWKATQKGGVYAFEVTRNARTGLWHPHVHVIIDGRYWPHHEARDAWRAALAGGSIWGHLADDDAVIVHLSAVHSRQAVARYIAKYITKPAEIADWPQAAILEYADALHGVRLLHTFGSLHGVKLAPADPNVNPGESSRLIGLAELDEKALGGWPLARRAVAMLLRVHPRIAYLVRYRPKEGDDPEPASVEATAKALPGVLRRVESGHWSHRRRPPEVWRLELGK